MGKKTSSPFVLCSTVVALTSVLLLVPGLHRDGIVSVGANITLTTTQRPAQSCKGRGRQQLPYACWAKDSPANVDMFLSWLIGPEADDPTEEYEYESYDGFYNNLAHPELGAAETPLLRTLPSAYSDGTYMPSFKHNGINPMTISANTMNGSNGMTSNDGKTAFLVFFGQQAVEEILDAQRSGCSPEYISIDIPEDEEIPKQFNNESSGLPREIPLLRSRYDKKTGQCPGNPRQQLNEITPWIDGGLMYGTAKAWSDVLRTMPDGSLAPHGRLATDEHNYPVKNSLRLPMANPPPPKYRKLQDVSRFHVLGNPRGSENPYLLSFGIMWVRWHNRIADYLHKTRPKWNDEKVFNEARKWVIGTYQHLVMDEWLPAWLGEKLSSYPGYRSEVDPQIAEVFQSAAMRFGHTLVVSGVHRRAYARDGCKPIRLRDPETGAETTRYNAIRTCNSYFRPQEFFSPNGSDIDLTNQEALPYDHLLMGLASQSTEKEDNIIVEDLRGFVFGGLDFTRRDLMAVNIQRGRDHGLPPYTTARRELGLQEIPSFNEFKEITDSVAADDVIRRAEAVHNGSIDLMDIWTGGILETRRFGPGQLFTAIIKNQFERIRDGDRFWFENTKNGLFQKKQMERIKQLKIKAVVLAVSDNMQNDDIQDNPFRLPRSDGCGGTNVFGLDYSSTGCLTQAADWKQFTCSCGKPGDGAAEVTATCYSLESLGNSLLEQCEPPSTYDYFEGSDGAYIATFSFLALWVIGSVGTLVHLSRRKTLDDEKKNKEEVDYLYGRVADGDEEANTEAPIPGDEWSGHKLGYRTVALVFSKSGRHPNNVPRLSVQTERGKPLRSLSLKRGETVTLWESQDLSSKLINVKTEHFYDLVVKFPSTLYGDHFVSKLGAFVRESGGTLKTETNLASKQIFATATTKEMRKKHLDWFMRAAFSQMLGEEIGVSKSGVPSFDITTLKTVVSTELTIEEFAEALSMRESSVFVKRIFELVDEDKNGFISYREFLDFLILSQSGTGEQKMRMLFDMYDLDKSGKMCRAEFVDMIRSFVELEKESLDSAAIQLKAEEMFDQAGLSKGADALTFEDFQRIMQLHRGLWDSATVDVRNPTAANARGGRDAARRHRDTVIMEAFAEPGVGPSAFAQEEDQDGAKLTEDAVIQARKNKLRKYLENNRKEIFWLVLYTGVTIAIAVERMYDYGFEAETGGLRKIAWYGVALTRAAASGMMFTYASLLLTMSRNLLTTLRSTFLPEFIPIDSMVSMHKYIACWALFFTLLHSVGHAVNFYHISVQPPFDMSCLFRDFYRSTHVLPTFGYWAWGTITGFTGILLLVLILTLYVFASQYARRHVFRVFWLTHNTYPAIYFLMLLHGMGTLVQNPLAGYFFVGPLIIFAMDKLISVPRRAVEIPVLDVEHLPSNVTKLVIKRPPTFHYQSGQWVRIASLGLSRDEYHPFTISSAPHEDVLTLHIRAVGPWTWNLRKKYDPTLHAGRGQYPRIYLDGPFGEGHQDWNKFQVAVMVGGGIGVTPFASILKDVAHHASTLSQRLASGQHQKMYFFWVTRNQKQFEWMIDILREVEEKDKTRHISTHIFITQLHDKFNFRMTLLYLFERHFQKVSEKSLFTQLRAKTHFGRPNFVSLLSQVGALHPNVKRIGVFSCGPPQMTSNVDRACQKLTETKDTLFQHHFENF